MIVSETYYEGLRNVLRRSLRRTTKVSETCYETSSRGICCTSWRRLQKTSSRISWQDQLRTKPGRLSETSSCPLGYFIFLLVFISRSRFQLKTIRIVLWLPNNISKFYTLHPAPYPQPPQ